jgi:hypothetical protein
MMAASDAMNASESGRFLMKALSKSLLVVAVITSLALVALQRSHVDVAPPPPKGSTASVTLPPTTSHLAVAATCPKTAIAAQLENAIPKTFHFDVNSDGFHVYGSPSRGAITVATDVAARRVSASTPVSGRVQVEKRVKIDLLLTKIDQNASVGIDVSGGISAALAPVITPKWAINPQLGLSAHANRAVAKTFLGDIEVTGLVRGPVDSAVSSVKGSAEAKLSEALDLRKGVERLWNAMNAVHKLRDNPPTWLRITPRDVTFGQFQYTNDSIDSGLVLDLDTHVFLQSAAPDVVKSPLPDLRTAGTVLDDFTLSVPVEVSYSVINQQFKAHLMNGPINLSQNTSVTIIDATVAPHGDGILLTVDFSGKKGWFQSASGRLYVVGVPAFDASKAELRVGNLEFTAETKSLLLQAVDWLAHASLLEAMTRAAVIRLDGELTKSKTKANEELDKLKTRLPSEVGASVSVTEINVDRLAFAKECAVLVATARGKMSARLKP